MGLFSFAMKSSKMTDILIGPVKIMGIINLSPDSFYSQSRCGNEEDVVQRALRLVQEGADIIDIGAESSRPGSTPVPIDEEMDRLFPVLKTLVKKVSIPISVDTYKPEVARRVLDLGVTLINDITGLQQFPEMARVVSQHKAGIVLMHMRGSPRTMQENTHYEDLINEITSYFEKSLEIATAAGIEINKIVLDPGIGFGKSVEGNLKLICELERFSKMGFPLLLGVSRKNFIGKILGLEVEDRLEGSLAATVIGVMKGARIIRTHDVEQTSRAVKMAEAILG